MPGCPVAHLAVDSDGQALPAGATYHGGLLRDPHSFLPAVVAVYDSLSGSGDLMDYFYAAGNERDSHELKRGVRVRRGLYIVRTAAARFTLYYDPAPRDRA